MTLKYESEILFDLMKRDGDDTPSDVLHYESELKEKYLNQVVGAYPKLQDYRPEWLNYNLYHHIPSEFPIESVTNVTNASFHNVVPYAYKSAILKGQTLVNLVGEKREYINKGAKLYGFEFMLPYNLTNGKNYLAIFDVSGTIGESNSRVYLMDYGFDSNTGNTTSTIPYFRLGHNVVKCLATCGDHKVLRIRTSYNDIENEKFTVSNVMLIEYQDGMENWDIPYFEGMKSVQMPVLTTTRKNLFDFEDLELGDLSRSNGTPVLVTNARRNKSFISVDGSQNFSFSMPNYIKTEGARYVVIHCYNINKEYISYIIIGDNLAKYENRPFLEGTKFVKITIEQTNPTDVFEVQLEYGKVVTPYEPHKSNILTTNEEVELRKVGDDQDELNLSTGELTQRVGEVFSNSLRTSGASSIGTYANVIPVNYPVNFLDWDNRNLICDKLKIINRADINWDKTSSINGISLQPTGFWFVVDKTITTQEQANEYLNNLNATIQYELPTTVIKTVDLSATIRPIEGTMHVSTSSQTLLPLLDMSVPVEATTQNLMSFANIVEEE